MRKGALLSYHVPDTNRYLTLNLHPNAMNSRYFSNFTHKQIISEKLINAGSRIKIYFIFMPVLFLNYLNTATNELKKKYT